MMNGIAAFFKKTKSDDLIFYFIALTFLLLPTGTAPPLIAFAAALLVWILSGQFLKIKSIVRQAWFRPVIPFVVLPWIGLLYSQNPELGYDYAEKTKYWLAVFVTASIAIDDKRMKILVRCLWIGLASGAFLAFLQVVGLIPAVRSDHLGFGVVHTLAGAYLIIGILMASYYFKAAQGTGYKIFLMVITALFVFHLGVLRGRAGYIIFGLMLPLIVGNLTDRFSLKLKWGFLILAAGIFLFSPVVKEQIKTTIIDVVEHKEAALKGELIKGDHNYYRFYIYHQAISIFLKHPITGIGTGSLTEPTRAAGSEVPHPHNNILYMGVSFGIVGIISCLWLFYKMFRVSMKNKQTATGYFVFSSCMVIFLGGLFDTSILNTGTLLFFCLSYGLLNHCPTSGI